MSKVLAGITVSVDGYIAGPNDGPGKGLGEGGERLHYWVFGGPWTYGDEPKSEASGEDAAWLDGDDVEDGRGRGRPRDLRGRAPLGRREPVGLPFFIVTHRPEEEPEGGAFTFVSGVEEAVERAREAAGDKDVHVMGGADVIRQALEAGLVDQLPSSSPRSPWATASGSSRASPTSLELEQLGVRQSQFATFIDYRVKR